MHVAVHVFLVTQKEMREKKEDKMEVKTFSIYHMHSLHLFVLTGNRETAHDKH